LLLLEVVVAVRANQALLSVVVAVAAPVDFLEMVVMAVAAIPIPAFREVQAVLAAVAVAQPVAAPL
jgi:hypothetical protein